MVNNGRSVDVDITDSGFFGARGDDGAEALDPAVIALVDELIADAPNGREGLLAVLLGVQRAFNRVSWRVQELVADRFGLSPAQVAGVVSFYPLLSDSRRGRRRLEVCAAVDCRIRGSEKLLVAARAAAARQQEAAEEPELEVRRVGCVGLCGRAPIVLSAARVQTVKSSDDAHDLVRRLLAGSGHDGAGS